MAIDPVIRNKVQEIFENAAFVRDLGIRLLTLDLGDATSELRINPTRHFQQDRFVHAGVVTTLADHTAGAAGESMLPVGQSVLTAEFKVNFLRPASGETLWCRARVLKPGRVLSVVESEVYCKERASDPELGKLVAKAIVTLAIVDRSFFCNQV